MRNITGPDSRLMPTRGGGFGRCCNAENVTSEDELIMATERTDNPTDMAWFGPMMHAAEDPALIEAHRPASDAPSRMPRPGPGSGGGIGQALADWRCCSEANLTRLGPDRLIATGKRRDLVRAAYGQDTGAPRGPRGRRWPNDPAAHPLPEPIRQQRA